MAVAEQIDFEIEFEAKLSQEFPLRRDFTASSFDAALDKYNFGLHLGPLLVDVKLSLHVGKRVAYFVVMGERDCMNRRASLARALTCRKNCEIALSRGLPVGGVY